MIRLGKYEIQPHYRGPDGACRINTGIVLSGSRAVADEFRKAHMDGQRKRVIFYRCPDCGQDLRVTLSISGGGGMIRYKVEEAEKSSSVGESAVGKVVYPRRGRRGDPIVFIKGKVFFPSLRPGGPHEGKIVIDAPYRVVRVIEEHDRWGRVEVEI